MSQLKRLLGKRIKEIRTSRGLTQEQLSEATNIGAPSISKIESGVYHPTDDNLEKISKALNIEPYKLYMFNYLKDPQDLKKEIDNKLAKASNDEIRIIYKIINAIID